MSKGRILDLFCKDWDREFNFQAKRLINYFSIARTNFERDKMQLAMRSLELLNDFDAEIYGKHHKNLGKQKFTIRYREFDGLCRKYIKACQTENNHVGGNVFFYILEDLRKEFKVESSRFVSGDYSAYAHKASETDIEQATKLLAHRIDGFDAGNVGILKIKGLKLYIYGENAYAEHNKQVESFPLKGNWWMGIEEFLYTERGWGKENISKVNLF